MAATIEIVLDDRNGGRGGSGGGGGRGGSGQAPDDNNVPDDEDFEQELKRIRKQLTRDSLLRRARKAGYLPPSDEDLPVAKEVNEEAEARKAQAEQRRVEAGERREEFRKREQAHFYSSLGRGAAGAVGQVGVDIARGGGEAGLNRAVDVAAMGLTRLGPVGIAAGAGLQAVTSGVNAFRESVNAINARGRELAGIDGRLAQSTAQADLIRMQADIREARQTADSVGRLIVVTEKANAIQGEILSVVKTFFADVAAIGIERGLNLLLLAVEVLNSFLPPVSRLDAFIKDVKDILSGANTADPLANWLSALTGFSAAPEVGPIGAAGRLFRAPKPAPLGAP